MSYVYVGPVHKGVSGFGVASLVIGIIAVLNCWIPFFNVVAVIFGVIGFALGMVGLLVSIIGGRSSVGMSVAGVTINGIAIAVSVLITGAIVTAAVGGIQAGQQRLQDAAPVEATQTEPDQEAELSPTVKALLWLSGVEVPDDEPEPIPEPNVQPGHEPEDRILRISTSEELAAERRLRTRIWKAKSGHTIEAELVAYVDGMLYLRKPDGTMIDVPLTTIHPDDQAVLRQMLKDDAVSRELPD